MGGISWEDWREFNGLGEAQLEKLTVLFRWERGEMGGLSCYHVGEVCMREGDGLFPKTLSKPTRVAVIFYLEMRGGGHIPHSWPEVLPSISASI